jgi:putative membrane protein
MPDYRQSAPAGAWQPLINLNPYCSKDNSMSIRNINRFRFTPVFAAAAIMTLLHSPFAAAADSMDFLKAASQGGRMEVDLGSMAKDHAASDAVKQFGETMVSEHSAANEKLMQLAKQKNVDLPDELKEEQQALEQNLADLSGQDFDKGYMSAMVEDHEKDVEEFRKQAEEGDDEAVRQFAAETLPTLEKHLQMAKDVHQQVNQ